MKVDISALYRKDSPCDAAKAGRSVCDPLSPWPDLGEVELDESQQEAMRYMLRSPVALVQGAPGTGKSYLGVKLARIVSPACGRSILVTPPDMTKSPGFSARPRVPR